jgi:hypothetical protein
MLLLQAFAIDELSEPPDEHSGLEAAWPLTARGCGSREMPVIR